MLKITSRAVLAAGYLAFSSGLAAAHGEPGALAHNIAHGYESGAGSLALGVVLTGALIVAVGYGFGHLMGKADNGRAASGSARRRD